MVCIHRIVCVGALCSSFMSCNREDAPRSPVVDAGPHVVDAGTHVVAPAPPVPPAPAPVAPVVPAEVATSPSTQEVVVIGPASLTWKGIDNKRGDSRITVRASALNVVAVDARRGSTHTIPIVKGVANYNALPKGELVVRATPRATLFLENDSIGTTPPAKPVKLPVGDYTVKLVFEDKVKTARVHVTAGAKAEIRMNMAE